MSISTRLFCVRRRKTSDRYPVPFVPLHKGTGVSDYALALLDTSNEWPGAKLPRKPTNIGDINPFVFTVKAGSFTAAAITLGMDWHCKTKVRVVGG